MTIAEAVLRVLEKQKTAMTVDEIHEAILAARLFDFKTAQPRQVLRAQIRRHCVGFDSPASSANKFFRMVEGNKYLLA